MEEAAEFWKRVSGIVTGARRPVLQGTVSEVDEDDRTCSLKVGGVTYEDVRLYAVADPSLKGLCLIPAVGSIVLASPIGGSNELYVTMFTAIDKVVLTVGDIDIRMDATRVEARNKKAAILLEGDAVTVTAGDTTVKASAGGVTMTRGSAGLKKTLSDLLAAIKELTVTTGVGPSGPPINIAEFVKVEQDLKNYLEG